MAGNIIKRLVTKMRKTNAWQTLASIKGHRKLRTLKINYHILSSNLARILNWKHSLRKLRKYAMKSLFTHLSARRRKTKKQLKTTERKSLTISKTSTRRSRMTYSKSFRKIRLSLKWIIWRLKISNWRFGKTKSCKRTFNKK